jgi:hypothetical protein
MAPLGWLTLYAQTVATRERATARERMVTGERAVGGEGKEKKRVGIDWKRAREPVIILSATFLSHDFDRLCPIIS